MRNFTTTLILLSMFFASCESKNNSKALMEYLQHKYPNSEIKIIKITSDSAYSPYRRIITLSMHSSYEQRDIMSISNDSWANHSINLIDSAIDRCNKLYNEITSAMVEITNDLQTNNTSNPNRIRLSSRFTINNIQQSDIFFLNHDGESVGHTLNDIHKELSELKMESRQVLSMKQSLKRDRRKMEQLQRRR